MPLKLVQRAGRPCWYIRGTFAGNKIFESTGCTDKREADRVRHEYEKRLLATEQRRGSPTVSQLIDIYLAAGGEDRFAEKIRLTLGHYYADEVGQGEADAAADIAYPATSAATRLRQFYTPLNSIMRKAVAQGRLKSWHITKPKAKRPVHKWAEPEWFEAFWPHCSPQIRALTTFLPYTGCRLSEALSLTWERVRLDDATAFIPQTKNGQPRMVHLPPVVVEQLRNIMPDQPGGMVFRWWKYKTNACYAIEAAIANANKARADQGLPPIDRLTSHQLGSHTYATWMRRYAGLDAFGLMATGRWKDQKSVAIYTHARPSEESVKSNMLPVPGKNSAKKRAKHL
jgi:integrase